VAQAQQQWGLSAADTQALEKQGAFIQGTSVLRTLGHLPMGR
jgi:hypothetical protein